MGHIYIAHNMKTDRAYIGKTIFNTKDRFIQHKSKSKKPNTYFHQALKKYGIDSFNITQIELPNEDLNEVEIFMIQDYKDNGIELYNLTEGGDGMSNISEEIKNKISDSLKGNIPWNKGKKLSPLSEEHKRKISKAGMGRICSEETRKKLSELNKGKNNPSAKPIILTHPNGKEEKFDYIKAAADKYILDSCCLGRVASGERKTHKKYKCKYVKE